MGCTCEAHYSVYAESLVRELRLYDPRGALASESFVVQPLGALLAA